MKTFRKRGFYTPVAALYGTAAAPGYTGPGDIASGAFAWWGFRAYNNAYISGTKHLVDLLDASGANPITIDCTATGVFDSSAYNTWATAHSVTAGTALVTKLYDQVSTNHLTQATTANMPAFNPTGVTSMSVANSFGGTFLNTGNITLAQALSVSVIAARMTNSLGNDAIIENGNTGDGVGFNSTLKAADSSGISTSNSTTLATPSAIQFLLKGAGSSIYLDGVSTSGTSGPFAFAGDPLYVNSSTVDVVKFTEGGLWSGDQSAHFSALNANQHAAYGGF